VKRIWVLKDCKKNTSNEIGIVNGKTLIYPNLFLIKTKNIKVITTVGCNKNYCKLMIKGDKEYFIETSIKKLINSIEKLPFIMISKSTAINMKYVKQILNTSYCFVNEIPYKIGKEYKKGFKDYLKISV